jgi:phosphoribosylamine--glycine ligase
LADATVAWSQEATVGVVLASGGYPGSYETGKVITGIGDVDDDVLVFHAGTRLDESGNVVTSGGRVLTVVGHGSDLATARQRAYANALRIEFEGRHYRTDIALRELPA